MLSYKRTTHSEDECSRNTDITLDMCPYKKRLYKNDDIRDKLDIAPIQEKLIQHRLRWFDHIQRRPSETPIHSDVLSHPENTGRARCRPNAVYLKSLLWIRITERFMYQNHDLGVRIIIYELESNSKVYYIL
jgi:hypothetical protein